jgi:hypothetical protein
MPGLLVDIKTIIHLSNNLLDEKKIDSSTGVVFLISAKCMKKIKNSKNKMEYFSSKDFKEHIKSIYYVYYDYKLKICEIRENVKNSHDLREIVESINIYLPVDTKIWVMVSNIENAEYYIKEGFDNPHMVKISPLNYNFQTKIYGFFKDNVKKPSVDVSSIFNKLNYTVKSNMSENIKKCNLYTRFTPLSISFLKKLNYPKELSGTLSVSKVIKEKEKIIFELSVNPESILIGNDEDVDAVKGRYNFHTHPKKAYDNHGVIKGWPSSYDYVGFLGLNDRTIFHTVVTIEGLYTISLSSEWDGDIKKVNRKKVLKLYNFNHNLSISFKEYEKQINSLKYNGKQLFSIKYLSWDNASIPLPFHYNKTYDNMCVTEDKVYNLYFND